ncbi:ATP-dependent zinc metalloprotease FtsH [Candidatus Woesebacteria bacterium]|nr:ATP-dependent zinc metalloprotease FtsH [Candidatus Woesebacteria bacterium]
MRQFKFEFDIRTLFIGLIVVAIIGSLWSTASTEMNKAVPEVSITQAIQSIKQGKIGKIEVYDTKVVLTSKTNPDKLSTTTKEEGVDFLKTLKDAGVDTNKVDVTFKNNSASANIINILINVVPTLLMIGFFIFIFRQARGAQESVFSFGSNRAKRFNKNMSKITFKDVAGVDEAKQELVEVVDFLKNPGKYAKLGARTPKGVLLVGPAGCGKTLLAKAVAGEAGVPFFSIAGSEFMEMLVGIGAARVRDLFTTAKKSSPSIIFIDEIDAIGRARSQGVMPAHDEREQTLNQILVEMDGFGTSDNVMVMAATNRGDLLDPALLRPGRFDRRIVVDYPDVEGRKAILGIHAKGKPFGEAVNWEKVAHRTVGFSGADLENMLNEAAIHAARNSKQKVEMHDIEEAATKVKLGPEKKRLQSDLDKKLTAYHEAGHAIVSHFMTHTDPVHRISIVSRGMALGFTLIPPAKDKLHETKTHLLERLAVMMGGRAAEQTVFNEVTTGAANDFDQSTRIAKAMVMEYGMSDLGPVNFGPTMDITEWGKSYYEQNAISQEMLGKIDQEVKKILELAYTQAVALLKEKRELLDKVATRLIETENMDGEEFEKIVGSKEGVNNGEQRLSERAI